jgi:hypothetical protein
LSPLDDAPEFAEGIGHWGLLSTSTIQASMRVPFINNALQREREREKERENLKFVDKVLWFFGGLAVRISDQGPPVGAGV